MTSRALRSPFGRALALAGVLAVVGAPAAFAQTVTHQPDTTVAAGGNQANAAAIRAWSASVWQAAAEGDDSALLAELDRLPQSDAPDAVALRRSIALLRENIAKRESARQTKLAEVRAKLEEDLAAGTSDLALSKALRDAVELEMYTKEKAEFWADRQITDLVAAADSAAEAAEQRRDWLMANELYFRLSLLKPTSTRYETKVRELGRRLTMIRFYAPQTFWNLRNERRLLEEDEPLPPFNALGEDFNTKLAGIREELVVGALRDAAKGHVEAVNGDQMVREGLRALEIMAQTKELAAAFPGLADDVARERFVDVLKAQQAMVGRLAGTPSDLLQDLQRVNAETVGLPYEALLHEFGNGAMSALDEYSNIIWPDEVRRFERNTSGKFIGIGVQIQLNELSNIEVVTPLEGTPAQRVGVRAGDVIKKVDGQSAIGFSLDQAVDVITGPEGTSVTLTVEREGEEGATSELDFTIRRAVIKLRSVKGWQRLDENEDRWNWFVDPQSRIGYIRLTQFHEETTQELDAAIAQMKAEGLRGLVLDLRFNPGGLLDQAVGVVSRFIDRRSANTAISGGVVVSTENRRGNPPMRPEYVEANRNSLAGVPVICLVNEGSASASEIVAGNLQDYARAGAIQSLVLGSRSFGKGSVQNVWYIRSAARAALKLTTQYYKLPGGRLIHKKPGVLDQHGVDPDLTIEMLPSQVTDAFVLRQSADVVTLGPDGKPKAEGEDNDPAKLIADGIDLQLHAAVVLLKSQALQHGSRHAQIGGPRQQQRAKPGDPLAQRNGER